MQMEQEQRLAEEVRRNAEQQAATLRYTVIVLQVQFILNGPFIHHELKRDNTTEPNKQN